MENIEIRVETLDDASWPETNVTSVYLRELMTSETLAAGFHLLRVRGECEIGIQPGRNAYDILLGLGGKAMFSSDKQERWQGEGYFVVRPPYATPYTVYVSPTDYARLLVVRVRFEPEDVAEIAGSPAQHSFLFARRFEDCPHYSEDIKSPKTVNRMVLPEGLVPRVGMGTVQTEGPDEVLEHEHPMLDQFFVGLRDCDCTVHANGHEKRLREGMLLHVPLASRHGVRVEQGRELHYLWIDLFVSLRAQSYLHEQHQIEGEENK